MITRPIFPRMARTMAFTTSVIFVALTLIHRTIAYPQRLPDGPQNSGEFQTTKLLPGNAYLKGNTISLLPGGAIGGWTHSSDELSWEVYITEPELIEVALGLSNTEHTSGAIIEITIGETTIVGTTVCSGGLGKIKEMYIGVGKVETTGPSRVTMRAKRINGGEVGQLYYVLLSGYIHPIASRHASRDVILHVDQARLSKSCAKLRNGRLEDWTDSALRLIWEIMVTGPGNVQVFLGLANTLEQAGTTMHFRIDNEELTSSTKYSGGLNMLKEMEIGSLSLHKTGKAVVELSAEEIPTAGVGHFYYVRLHGVSATALPKSERMQLPELTFPDNIREEYFPKPYPEEYYPKPISDEYFPESHPEEYVPKSHPEVNLPEPSPEVYLPEPSPEEFLPQPPSEEHFTEHYPEELLPEHHLDEYNSEEYINEPLSDEHLPGPIVEEHSPIPFPEEIIPEQPSPVQPVEITGIKGYLTQADVNSEEFFIAEEKEYGIWTSLSEKISWEVNIANPGELEVYIYLANEDTEAGAEIIAEIGEDKIYGLTQSSGGLDKPLLMHLGKAHILTPGTAVITLYANKIVNDAVGKLYYIMLSGTAAEGASFVTMLPEMQLPSSESVINGHGAIHIGNEKIGEWRDTNAQFIWEVSFIRTGDLYISLVLANMPSQEGARIMIDVDGQRIIGTTRASGGLNHTAIMPMGSVSITRIGKLRITVQAESINDKAVGELYYVMLKGLPTKGAHLSTGSPQLQLDATDAIISGPGANHVDNVIKNWSDTDVKIIWDVNFENTGELFIYLGLANTIEEAGAEVELQVGEQHINGLTASSGGLDRIQQMPIGSLNITSPGPYRLIMKANSLEGDSVGILYYLMMKGDAAEGATSAQPITGIDLMARDAKITGPGAIHKGEVITEWTEPTVDIVWEVNIANTGLLDLSLALGNKPEEAGATIEIQVGDERIVGQTGSSGGNDHPQVMHMGSVDISTPGTIYITAKALNTSHIFVGDLHFLRLSGPASVGAFIPTAPAIVRLPAATAIITGPGASHFGDEKISFWDSSTVHIVWQVNFTKTGKLSVFLGLANTPEDSHARIEVTIGPYRFVGTTLTNSDPNNVKEMLMGIINILTPGTYKVILRAENIPQQYVGDLYYLLLSGPAAQDAAEVNAFPKVQLFASDAMIDGPGASYLGNKEIGAWDSTSVKVIWELNIDSTGDLYVSLGLSNIIDSAGSEVEVSLNNESHTFLTKPTGHPEEIQEMTVGEFSINNPGKYDLAVQAINIVGSSFGNLHYVTLKGPATKSIKLSEEFSGLQLDASDALILGDGATLNNDHISWKDPNAEIIWEVNFNSVGDLFISFAMANNPKDAGATIQVTLNDTVLETITPSTNGLENVYVVAVGKNEITTPGPVKITFKANTSDSQEIGDLYYLQLKGTPVKDAALQEYPGVKLLANDAKISGTTTKLEDNKIVNWMKTSTQIMWQISLANSGLLSVSVGLANTKENSGSEIELQIGDSHLYGTTAFSDGGSKIEELNMGTVNIPSPGTVMILLRANKILGSSVGDLYYVLLKGPASLEASKLDMATGLQLQANDALISGHGAAHVGEEMISFWSNTDATISWDVNFVQTGQLFLSVGIGNTQEQANAQIEVKVGDDTIKGTTIYSGGLSNPESMHMGYVTIDSVGIKRITLRADSIPNDVVGNLYYIVCEGPASRGATLVDRMHKLQLNTMDALIDGNGAGFLENKYIGIWKDTKAKIIWPVTFNTAGELYTSVGLANTDEQVGSTISVQIGKEKTEAPTIMSGGLDRIQLMPVGKLTIAKPGTYDITVQATKINGNSVGDLYYLLLKGPATQGAELQNAYKGFDLQVADALVFGKGIERIDSDTIGNWTGSSAFVRWDVNFPSSGSVYVYTHLDNTQSQAGSSIKTEIGNQSTTGITVYPKTSLSTLMNIGKVTIPTGGDKAITLRGDQIKDSGIGTMDRIQLRGSAITTDLKVQQYPVFRLNVSDAVISGSGIHYDSDANKIDTWSDTTSTITWKVNIPEADWYEIWVGLANSEDQAKANLEIKIGENVTQGKTKFSGGLDKVNEMYIGSILLVPSTNAEIVLRAINMPSTNVGELHYIQLRGLKTDEVSLSTGETPEMELLPNNCKISGPGARIEDNTITEWTSTDVDLQWDLDFSSTGKFEVVVVMDSFSPDSELEATIGDKKITATLKEKELHMGSLEIKSPGKQTFTLRASTIKGDSVGVLRSVLLRGMVVMTTTVTVLKSRDAGMLWLYFEPDVEATMSYNEIKIIETYPMTFYAVLESSEVYIGMRENFNGIRKISVNIGSRHENTPNEDAITVLRNAVGGEGEIFSGYGMSTYTFVYEYNWKVGDIYKFILTQHQSSPGFVTTSAFFYHPEEGAWMLLASVDRKISDTYLRGLHSYVRDDSFQFGHKHRITEFSPWVFTKDGEWIEVASAAVICPVEKGNGNGYVKDGEFVLQSGDDTTPCTEPREIYERKTEPLPDELQNINNKLKIATMNSHQVAEVKTNEWTFEEENLIEQQQQQQQQQQAGQQIQLEVTESRIGSQTFKQYWLTNENGERKQITEEEYERWKSGSQVQQSATTQHQYEYQYQSTPGDRIEMTQETRGGQSVQLYWLVSSDGQRRQISKEQAALWMQQHSTTGQNHRQVSGEQLEISQENRNGVVTTYYWLVSADGQRRQISEAEANVWKQQHSITRQNPQQVQGEQLEISQENRNGVITKHYWLVSADGQRRQISEEEANIWMQQHSTTIQSQTHQQYQSTPGERIEMSEETRGGVTTRLYWLVSADGQRRQISEVQASEWMQRNGLGNAQFGKTTPAWEMVKKNGHGRMQRNQIQTNHFSRSAGGYRMRRHGRLLRQTSQEDYQLIRQKRV